MIGFPQEKVDLFMHETPKRRMNFGYLYWKKLTPSQLKAMHGYVLGENKKFSVRNTAVSD
jgi:hypothetical protein